MQSAFGFAILALMVAFAVDADETRTYFNEIKLQEITKPHTAFTEMMALAQAGYIPATDRVGYYFRHGLGTPPDMSAARHWYRRAASGGHPWSFVSLARTELDLGHSDAALRLLQSAVKDQRPGAARLLGTAHIDRAFGPASDQSLGRQILLDLERGGDAQAARDLLLRYNWNRLRGQAPAHIVERVVQLGLAGDARFAEAALVYLGRENNKRGETIEQRSALARVPGIRRHILLKESVRLAAERCPARFWLEVEDLLKDAEPEHYVGAVSTAFWINKNAWVRVLQMELRTLGYYHGAINAKMTGQTIRAQSRFCKDRGIPDVCALGPLHGRTMRAVAGLIAALRMPSSPDGIAVSRGSAGCAAGPGPIGEP